MQRQSPSLRNVTHSAYVWEPFANEIRHVEVYQKKNITTRKVLRPKEQVVTYIQNPLIEFLQLTVQDIVNILHLQKYTQQTIIKNFYVEETA